jgi:single-stranded DNA-binding protein
MLQLNAILNLGADAECKTINDKKYISFRGASTERKDGKEQVTWVQVLSGYSENLLQYLKKGQQVFVSGRMKAGIYQNNNNIGMDISVFASTLQLCGGKKEESADKIQTPAADTRPETTAQQSFVSPFPPAVDESGNAKSDDLPF